MNEDNARLHFSSDLDGNHQSSSSGGGPTTPSPTRASLELPDEVAVRAAGIELTLDEARLVLVALSRVIAGGRSKTREKVANLGLMLRNVCSLPFERDGRCDDAPHPELADLAWPNGRQAMKRLGIDHRVLTEYWVVARNRADDSSLPLNWVLAFVPAKAWRLVATLIAWGPDETRARVEEAAVVLAHTPISRPTRSRPAGSYIARGTIENRISCLWDLLQVLVTLRNRVRDSRAPSLDLGSLDAWRYKPPRPDTRDCGARDAHVNTAGPPLEDCARRLKELVADYERARRGQRYLRLRRVVLLALLALYGPREDAIRRARTSDVIVEHLFADGVRGPALRLFLGKTRDHDEPFFLPLPTELFEWLQLWILANGHTIGESDAPLFPSTSDRGEPLTPSGLFVTVAGRPNKHGGGSYALLAANGNPYVGYRPHSYRHTAFQAAMRAATIVKQASPEAFAYAQPVDFARAVVGHAMEKTVADVYRDLSVHELARAAVGEAWKVLWGDRLARRGPDPARIRVALAELELARAAAAACVAELRRLETEQGELVRRIERGSGLEHAEASARAQHLATQSFIAQRELHNLTTELDRAMVALEHAKNHDVPIADDISDEEYQAALEAVRASLAGVDGSHLADELTTADVAEVFGTTVQTINHWVRNGPPSKRATPWTADAWNVYSPHKKRLRVAGIATDALSELERERLIAVRRRRQATDDITRRDT